MQLFFSSLKTFDIAEVVYHEPLIVLPSKILLRIQIVQVDNLQDVVLIDHLLHPQLPTGGVVDRQQLLVQLLPLPLQLSMLSAQSLLHEQDPKVRLQLHQQNVNCDLKGPEKYFFKKYKINNFVGL